MTGKSYTIGRRFENYVRDILENSGWIVVRCAASKPIDLLACRNGVRIAVECRKTGRLTDNDMAKLSLLSLHGGFYPVLAYKSGKRVTFKCLCCGRDMYVSRLYWHFAIGCDKDVD